jgi:NADH-quinone oxidoreductase subunit K
MVLPIAEVPLEHSLLLAAVLFGLGLLGVLVRRNMIYILICIEIMFNAAGLAFIAAGARWGGADGQVLFILVLTVAAANVSVGLALLLRMFRTHRSLDADRLSDLKG